MQVLIKKYQKDQTKDSLVDRDFLRFLEIVFTYRTRHASMPWSSLVNTCDDGMVKGWKSGGGGGGGGDGRQQWW